MPLFPLTNAGPVQMTGAPINPQPVAPQNGILAAWNAMPPEKRAALLFGISRGLGQAAQPTRTPTNLGGAFGIAGGAAQDSLAQYENQQQQNRALDQRDRALDVQTEGNKYANASNYLKLTEAQRTQQLRERTRADALRIIQDPATTPAQKRAAHGYLTSERDDFIDGMYGEAKAPTTRTITQGGREITQEWNNGQWSEVGSGPRWNPDSNTSASNNLSTSKYFSQRSGTFYGGTWNPITGAITGLDKSSEIKSSQLATLAEQIHLQSNGTIPPNQAFDMAIQQLQQSAGTTPPTGGATRPPINQFFDDLGIGIE